MSEQNDLERRITHVIPSDLEEMKTMLPAALMYLARGERPNAIPAGENLKVNFRINSMTDAYITRLTPEFGGSRTQVIIHALAWAAERDDRQQLMLTNTKL